MARRPASPLSPGWVAGAVVAAACALSMPALADEPEPSEASTSPSVHPPPSAQANLLLIGAGVTAGWYGAAFGLSYLWPNSPGASALRIPVAGPYMSLAKTGCGSGESGCGTFTLVIRTVLTSLSLVGQTGGVLAMVEGVFLPTSTRAERMPPRSAAHRATFQFSPLAPATLGFSSSANPVLDGAASLASAGHAEITGSGNRASVASAFAPLGLTFSGNF